ITPQAVITIQDNNNQTIGPAGCTFTTANAVTSSLFFQNQANAANQFSAIGASTDFTIVGNASYVNKNSASYYYYYMALGNASLPIDLISFTAERVQKDVILNWTTGKENNFSLFEIEKSIDG